MNRKQIKGIVVKVTDTHTVILCEDGRFKNIPRATHDPVPLLGQPYSYSEKRRSSFRWILLAAVVAALLLAIVAYNLVPLGSHQPVYIVAVDINPSMEIYATQDLEVVDVHPLNDDAEQIVHELDWQGQSVLHMIQQVVKASIKKRYLHAGEEALVTVSVINEQDETFAADDPDVTSEIESIVRLLFKEHHLTGMVSVMEATPALYEEAKQLNLSVNQYRVYEQLLVKGLVQHPDQIRGKSVAELIRMEKDIHEKDLENQKPANKNTEDSTGKPDQKQMGPNVPAHDMRDKQESIPSQPKDRLKEQRPSPEQGEGSSRSPAPIQNQPSESEQKGAGSHQGKQENNRSDQREQREQPVPEKPDQHDQPLPPKEPREEKPEEGKGSNKPAAPQEQPRSND
ncbi:hypothetical protein CathTA2_0650 [Caldalkalibacillus thermarum TA2.A1]|uniref:RsgI N-terminal anti-sigma domain-containing protein n=1 Tax=Caldalkalibacillus thermarum (strain TA2.A1) TaxID=986075 RepID=F5L4D8_CALTT|nr:hypothetical protein [Caldalkalibacillus thermarum]EGL83781.1 hypothetical protein CathTA2_0650 [Caldalkalibacillus thermarum TA2.A1]QZT33957.1 hypothetical protein HUR95_00505 [Caldalkalibacillus thermarum TA2.A1]